MSEIPTKKAVKEGLPGWKICGTCFGTGKGLQYDRDTGLGITVVCPRCQSSGVVQVG